MTSPVINVTAMTAGIVKFREEETARPVTDVPEILEQKLVAAAVWCDVLLPFQVLGEH